MTFSVSCCVALVLLALPATAFAPAAAAGRLARRPTALDAIAVFGATGQTGKEAVFQALGRGEKVTCLCRDTSRLVAPDRCPEGGKRMQAEGLTAVQGDVTSAADVAKVFEGQDVTGVVVALGGKTADVGPTMLTDGTRNIIDACVANGVKRISVVTSIGAGDSESQAPFFFKVLMWTAMKNIFVDKNNQEALFIGPGAPGAGLDFTVVRPGGLTLDPPNGIVNVIKGEAGSIARADVASFCLDAVTAADWQYTGQTPCISSDKGTSWQKDRTAATQGER